MPRGSRRQGLFRRIYGYHVGKSTLAFLRPEIAPGTGLEVMILGRPHARRFWTARRSIRQGGGCGGSGL
ncbi:MAG: hypothetical protein R3D61_02425 [Defluviimonas denitrificans]